jgi:hypothetical protein
MPVTNPAINMSVIPMNGLPPQRMQMGQPPPPQYYAYNGVNQGYNGGRAPQNPPNYYNRY